MGRERIRRQAEIRQISMPAEQVDLGGQRADHQRAQIRLKVHGSPALNNQRRGQNAGCGKLPEALFQGGLKALPINLKRSARSRRCGPQGSGGQFFPPLPGQSAKRIGYIAKPYHVALNSRGFAYAQPPHITVAADGGGRRDRAGLAACGLPGRGRARKHHQNQQRECEKNRTTCGAKQTQDRLPP